MKQQGRKVGIQIYQFLKFAALTIDGQSRDFDRVGGRHRIYGNMINWLISTAYKLV